MLVTAFNKAYQVPFRMYMRCISFFPSLAFIVVFIIKIQLQKAAKTRVFIIQLASVTSVIADKNSYRKYKNVTYINKHRKKRKQRNILMSREGKKQIFHKFVSLFQRE